MRVISNFEHTVDVSAGAAGFDHALGDDLAHVGHGTKSPGMTGGSCRAALGRTLDSAPLRAGLQECPSPHLLSRATLDEIEDVLLVDAATGAGCR